jgi:DNA-binding GntR family transcriptional regulator
VFKTQNARVYQALRQAILDGELVPGERLRLVELAARYSVSQSVVREALTRLAEQGLAVSLPQQGFRVITLSETDLEDLTDTRIAIEGLVLGRAVSEGDVEWESTALAAHHRLVRAQSAEPGPRSRERWVQAHTEFHRALLAGCASPRLKEIALGLRDAAELYRRWSPSSAASLRRIASEHQALIDAALARNSQQAVQALSEHLHHTREALLHPSDSQASSAQATGS